jgi:hypothetical protein
MVPVLLIMKGQCRLRQAGRSNLETLDSDAPRTPRALAQNCRWSRATWPSASGRGGSVPSARTTKINNSGINDIIVESPEEENVGGARQGGAAAGARARLTRSPVPSYVRSIEYVHGSLESILITKNATGASKHARRGESHRRRCRYRRCAVSYQAGRQPPTLPGDSLLSNSSVLHVQDGTRELSDPAVPLCQMVTHSRWFLLLVFDMVHRDRDRGRGNDHLHWMIRLHDPTGSCFHLSGRERAHLPARCLSPSPSRAATWSDESWPSIPTVVAYSSLCVVMTSNPVPHRVACE